MNVALPSGGESRADFWLVVTALTTAGDPLVCGARVGWRWRTTAPLPQRAAAARQPGRGDHHRAGRHTVCAGGGRAQLRAGNYRDHRRRRGASRRCPHGGVADLLCVAGARNRTRAHRLGAGAGRRSGHRGTRGRAGGPRGGEFTLVAAADLGRRNRRNQGVPRTLIPTFL